MKYRVKIRAKAVGATCDQLAEIKHIKAEGKILLVQMEGNEESKTIDVNDVIGLHIREGLDSLEFATKYNRSSFSPCTG